MIEPSVLGAVGSPADVGTLLVVLWAAHGLKAKLSTVATGLVAVARPRDDVDDERLQAELDVDDRDVASLVGGVVDDREVAER